VDAERLAAYLAGELDADGAAAVEAAVARDPRLRADLDAMRRADAALGSLPATELPAGFESRLRAAVDHELSTLLRGELHTTAQAAPPARRDELAVRRARRSRSWVPAFAGAAAAVVVLAGVAVGVGVLGGADDQDGTADTAMTLESFADADAEDAGEAEAGMALPEPGDGPTIIASDRDLDDGAADELLASIELEAVAERGFDADTGRSVGAAWRAALSTLGPGAGAADERAETAEDGEPELEEAAPTDDDEAVEAEEAGPEVAGDTAVRLFADGPLDDEALAAADRCLTEVIEADTDAIPVYLELASYLGEPAVVVGLVTFDPATDAFTRPEVWVLSRDDCQVLRFSQG
jgi:negative regulator of sigma E activity